MQNNNTLRWLYQVPGRKKGYIVLLTLVQALLGGSGVLYALLLRAVVDAATGRHAAVFWRYVIMMSALVGAQLALRAVLRWLTELSKATLENSFKRRLMNELLRKEYARVSAVHSGEWMNRLTNDTVVIANGYTDILPGLTGMAVKLISAAVMLIALDARFAAILFPGGLILTALTYAFRRVLKKLHKTVQEADGTLRIFLQEHIGSMVILRSFAAESRTSALLDEHLDAHLKARMKRNHFSNFCNIGFGIAMRGMYLFGVCWCGYGILTGTVTFGTLTAVTQLITQIQTPFANISGYLPRYYAVIASAERLMEIEALHDDEQLPSFDNETIQQYYHTQWEEIRLQQISFAYPSSFHSLDETDALSMPLVLRDLSLTIHKGDCIALTGHSGCGKSTLLKLLMCVYTPNSGQRLLVNRDASESELHYGWRRLFAYVPQGNHLMSGSIRDAVAFAAPSEAHDEARLAHALTVACADGFVNALEHGTDTLLGERGAGLSEGQLQRLAIARAVFSDRPILLLDEATSALDTSTEAALLRHLKTMTDKTVVLITHRPAALAICDRVIRFTENGTEERDNVCQT